MMMWAVGRGATVALARADPADAAVHLARIGTFSLLIS